MEMRQFKPELKLWQAKLHYESFEKALPPEHEIDYHIPISSICNFRPTKFQREYNRVKRVNSVQVPDFAKM